MEKKRKQPFQEAETHLAVSGRRAGLYIMSLTEPAALAPLNVPHQFQISLFLHFTPRPPVPPRPPSRCIFQRPAHSALVESRVKGWWLLGGGGWREFVRELLTQCYHNHSHKLARARAALA